MRFDRPTREQLKANFEAGLASMRSGGGLNHETGLDRKTESALWEISAAYPEVPDALIDAARAAFAGQLDGSNAAARRADLERRLAGRAVDTDPGALGVAERPDGPVEGDAPCR